MLCVVEEVVLARVNLIFGQTVWVWQTDFAWDRKGSYVMRYRSYSVKPFGFEKSPPKRAF